jgi:hypothetical protein
VQRAAFVTTLELHPRKVEYARTQIAKAGLAEFVDFKIGDALATLRDLPGPFDFVLLDLWKDLYIPSFDLIYTKLADGALIVADNMLHPERAKPDANRYRARVREGRRDDDRAAARRPRHRAQPLPLRPRRARGLCDNSSMTSATRSSASDGTEPIGICDCCSGSARSRSSRSAPPVWVAQYVLAAPLPIRPIVVTVGALALWNVLGFRDLYSDRRVRHGEVALHLIVDVAAFTVDDLFHGRLHESVRVALPAADLACGRGRCPRLTHGRSARSAASATRSSGAWHVPLPARERAFRQRFRLARRGHVGELLDRGDADRVLRRSRGASAAAA